MVSENFDQNVKSTVGLRQIEVIDQYQWLSGDQMRLVVQRLQGDTVRFILYINDAVNTRYIMEFAAVTKWTD